MAAECDTVPRAVELPPETAAFYREVLAALKGAGVPFLVGGAYAFERYTGIVRHTKDLDVFVLPTDTGRTLEALAEAGYRTEMTDPLWLGKAYCDGDFVDIIFSSGNGLARVDEGWFCHATESAVVGVPVKLIPPEEMIWSKGFVMTRERYDGADVAHILRAHAETLDWHRLLERFGPNWRVLFSHLVLFGYIYPGQRTQVPDWVMQDLLGRLDTELRESAPPVHLCRGTMLSTTQYRDDVDRWGYLDARVLVDNDVSIPGLLAPPAVEIHEPGQ